MTTLPVISVVRFGLCLLPFTPILSFSIPDFIELLVDKSPRSHGRRREIEFAANTYIDPEAFMNTPEIIRTNGYPAETHKVETEDGYLIDIHRIPSKGIPVLLMHCLLCSSATWVENTVNISLAYLLSDVGFDVWLGNVRGNTYGKKHRTLKSSKKNFWNFTVNEYGQYDVAAIIDYIVKSVDYRNILYVGHSLGNAEILILLSRRPEYTKKVKGLAALAPCSVLGNIKSSAKAFAPYINAIKFTLEFLGHYEIGGAGFLDLFFSSRYCQKPNGNGLFRFSNACKIIWTNYVGYNPEQLNETRIPVYLHHNPAGTSLYTLYHLAQLVKSKKFAPLDYGSATANEAIYGSSDPPEYDVTKVNVPVSLFWSDRDLFSDPQDVKWLADRLPNIHLNYLIPDSQFTHLDFIWAINAREIIYNKVIEALQEMWKL